MSWIFTEAGITPRFLSAMDYGYALEATPDSIILISLALIMLLSYSVFPFRGAGVHIPREFAGASGIVAFITMFFVVQNKLDVMFPFRNLDAKATNSSRRIRRSFSTPWESHLIDPTKPKKNLILIEVESLESKAIGKFNSWFPKSMPYLSSLTETSMYFTNIRMQPYTTWSAAGMFVVQCGLPLLQDDVHWDVRQFGDFHGYRRVPCISNFLYQNGYRLYAFCSATCNIMNMKNFLITRGFHTQDSDEHGFGDDTSLFHWLERSMLPDLKGSSEPFVLLILSDDTHFIEFRVGSTCNDYLGDEGYPQGLRSFTCVDQLLKEFVDKVKELGLDENTEIVIYGDHIAMGDQTSVYGPNSERNLSVFFPLRAQDEGWRIGRSKDLSYYDMAPTIMELMNIEYSPPFPFGRSMLKPGKGEVPNVNDFKQIYRFVTGLDSYENVRCLGQKGFCQGDEY